MRRRTIVMLAAAGTAVAVPAAAYGYLAATTRDAPPPASLGAAPSGTAAASGDGATDGATDGGLDGTWAVAEAQTNFAGYRIRERLGPVAAPSDAVGRTGRVDGTATIEDGRLVALDLQVDVASLDSGSPRRDEFVRTEALRADRFPAASLRLAEPVDVDGARRGRVVELDVPAELNLRGETRAVSFDVQARWNGSSVQAAGRAEIDRDDFGIDVSSEAGFNIDDTGTIEFEVTFAPEGGPVVSPPSTLVDNPQTPTDEGERQPPCRGSDRVRLDPPVLVSSETGSAARFAIVAGAGQVAPVRPLTGLSGGASWSPDGRLVVHSASQDPEAPRTLAVVPAAGGTPAPVPGLTDVVQPDWGPGGRIAFVQRTGEAGEAGGAGERGDVWLTDPDGGRTRRLVATPGADGDPRWSPDGRTLVFTTATEDGNQDVVLVDRDGQNLRTLAGGPDYEYTPSFTPDGSRVLFVRDGAVFSIAVDGSGERRLTDGPDDVSPEMSPDGERLAFVRRGSLHVAGADGSGVACVETGEAITAGPRWRP
jgi:polyisoprenoid-binding protein YceI